MFFFWFVIYFRIFDKSDYLKISPIKIPKYHEHTVYFRQHRPNNRCFWFMNDENFDFQSIYDHWVAISDKDYATMQRLFQSKDYHWALFIGHLVLER